MGDGLQQNYTQAQIIKQLEVVCALSPEPFRDQCDSFVEYYVPVLINYIIKYEDPQNACQQLGLCTSFATEPEIVVADLEKFPEVVEVVEASPEECQICKMLVGFVESYVQANQTVTQIESLLGRVCRLTPFASQCVLFVDTYTPLIVQYIQANEDPRPCASSSASALRRPSARSPPSSSTERALLLPLPLFFLCKVHLFFSIIK